MADNYPVSKKLEAVLDRDVNAARNVLASAFSSLGRSDQDGTWAAAPGVS
jgi:transposase